MSLIKDDGSGNSARILEGIAFVENFKLIKGSQLDTVGIVTVHDCARTKRNLIH